MSAASSYPTSLASDSQMATLTTLSSCGATEIVGTQFSPPDMTNPVATSCQDVTHMVHGTADGPTVLERLVRCGSGSMSRANTQRGAARFVDEDEVVARRDSRGPREGAPGQSRPEAACGPCGRLRVC